MFAAKPDNFWRIMVIVVMPFTLNRRTIRPLARQLENAAVSWSKASPVVKAANTPR
jgi:hypothetical protein